MDLTAEHVILILLVLAFIAIMASLLFLTFSGGNAEISKNTTIIELFKVWS